MEFISASNKAVFFVDILGMSALTNNQINLTDEDYSPWLDQNNIEYSDQFLAASILVEFRNILMEFEKKYPNVTISQLSDCAFVWSKNIRETIIFVSNFMTTAIRHGLLCRGGLTYGEIIETCQSQNLGRFIVGKAVSDAVKLEKIAKGARVLIDDEFPHHLWEQDEDFAKRINPLFAPFTNPLDYTTYDEFRWYVSPDLDENVKSLDFLKPAERIKLTKERLKIANIIRYSPKFNWNSKSKEGLIQIRSSIRFVAANEILDILHNFEWISEGSNRTEGNVNNTNELIDSYLDYKLIERNDEIEWIEY